MQEPTEFEVDGQKYVVQPFLTSYGMKLLTEISLLVGEAALRAVFELKDSKAKDPKAVAAASMLDSDVDPDAMVKVMNQLTARIQPDTIDSLFKRILKCTLLAGSSNTCEKVYDVHFQGKYGHLFKVVFKSLQAQYGDFLTALSASAGIARGISQK